MKKIAGLYFFTLKYKFRNVKIMKFSHSEKKHTQTEGKHYIYGPE